MRLNIIYIFLFVVLTNCGSNKVIEVHHKEEVQNERNIHFSEKEVEYFSNALKYSSLTKEKNIVDLKSDLDSGTFKKVKALNIYTNNTMNFINSYNDTINVVFSFPKRECLQNSLSDYLWNFSNSMQYIIINTQESVLVDSMKISHETRIVPPIDCIENKK